MLRAKAKATKSNRAQRTGAIAAARYDSERLSRSPALNRKRQQERGVIMTEKKPVADSGNGEHNVDQIRDILFGGQMREFDRRFQELSKRLEQESTRLGGDMEKRIAALESRMDGQLERLGKQLRQEVGDRGKAVDELESRVLQAASTARNEINASINSLQEAIDAAAERERKTLAEKSAQIESVARQANNELVAARDQLRHDKVDREDLAAHLTELALRLRGEFELPAAK